MNRTEKLLILVVLIGVALAYLLIAKGCSKQVEPGEPLIEEARNEHALAEDWRVTLDAYSDSLEILEIENSHLRYAAEQAIRQAQESDRQARASNRTAQELSESLSDASTAADTLHAFNACTRARIGLIEALNDCEAAGESRDNLIASYELTIATQDRRASASDSALTHMGNAYTLATGAYEAERGYRISEVRKANLQSSLWLTAACVATAALAGELLDGRALEGAAAGAVACGGYSLLTIIF